MAGSRRSIARRLGDPVARRRRHRLVVAAAVVLLALSAVLIFVVDGDDDDDFGDRATPTCTDFRDRVQREFALSFPEGVPSAAASAEYLSHAFADTMDDLVVALRALDPSAEAGAAIDALAGRIEEIRAGPEAFAAAATDPFADGVAARFDALGVEACGSEFFIPSP